MSNLNVGHRQWPAWMWSSITRLLFLLLGSLPVSFGQTCSYSCPEVCGHCDFGDITLAPVDYCRYPSGCLSGVARFGCCCAITPVLVDVAGDGIKLSSARDGVLFQPTASARPMWWAWPQAGADDAWLALDRNENGNIDDATELFGNLTPQPSPPNGVARNGFLALAVFDEPANGGNGDGQIDAHDRVFTRLRLWFDQNRDGRTQAGELQELVTHGVLAIGLAYKESKRTDQHGNQFLFRSRLRTAHQAEVSRWAWDVVVQTLARNVSGSSTFGTSPAVSQHRPDQQDK